MWCRQLRVQLQWELQVELWVAGAQDRSVWAADPLHGRGLGDLVRVTQGHSRRWASQTFTYIDCEGIKAQRFLSLGLSLEAPAWAVDLLFSYCTKIKPLEGSVCLRLSYGKPRVRKPGLTVWVKRCSCKGASVPAQAAGVGLQEWLLCGQRGRFP